MDSPPFRMESASLILEGGNSSFNSFDTTTAEHMDLFDLTDLYMSSDLPDFITSQEVTPPNSSQEFSSTDSSPVSSPPSSFSVCVPDLLKNEPLSPGQVSDGGSSGDEACYIDFARISPVKSELFPAFVNPASLDVKFCNERVNSPLSSASGQQARRTLKRRRETTIKPTISPDQLYPGNLEAQKQLSPEEERELKKQKRLIKNRESAQKSRQRRKAYIEELEQKVAVLTSQGEQLAQENKVLKDDLAYLLGVLKKTPGVPSEVLSKTSSLGGVSTPIRGVKAAGVCLLIVLFSFGLFFNAKNGPTGPSLPFDPNMPREPIPEVLPTSHYHDDKKYSSRMLKSLKDAEFDERRDLLEIFPERGRRRPTVTIKEETVQPSEQPMATGQHVPLDTVIKKERYHDDRPSPREAPCIKKQKKSGNWTKTPVAMDVEEEGSLVPLSERSGSTSYFFCSEPREVIMQDGSSASQQPRTVSLLVPLEAFNGTAAGEGPLSQHLQNHDPSNPAIVEVACQVINMNVFTASPSNNNNTTTATTATTTVSVI